jgi:hypothetical protein
MFLTVRLVGVVKTFHSDTHDGFETFHEDSELIRRQIAGLRRSPSRRVLAVPVRSITGVRYGARQQESSPEWERFGSAGRTRTYNQWINRTAPGNGELAGETPGHGSASIHSCPLFNLLELATTWEPAVCRRTRST